MDVARGSVDVERKRPKRAISAGSTVCAWPVVMSLQHVQPSRRAALRPSPRHRSEQNFTLGQSLDHFRRQANDRLQTAHILVGMSDLRRIFGMGNLPAWCPNGEIFSP
jgi:hypothetical protein